MASLNNIDKYLEYYSNTSLEDNKWNEVDYLYCSLLSYLNLTGVSDNMTYSDFCNLAISQAPKTKYGKVVSKVIELIKIYKDNIRYQNMRILHYQYIIDENTQFGAMVFYINQEAIVSFTGSDGSIIGWIENLRQSYKYPVYTQIKAKEYLESIIDEFDNITLLGHSKGGNLAMYSALGLSDENLNKIKQIYNFDGPGFFKEIIESKEYKRIENKITSFIPEESYIGSMMYHGGKIRIVKTTCKGIDVHFQFNWILFGTFIDEGDKFKDRYNYVHHTTTVRWDKLDKSEVEKTMENAFELLNVDKTKKLKVKASDILKAIDAVRKSDSLSYKEFLEIIQVFMYADISFLKRPYFKKKN